MGLMKRRQISDDRRRIYDALILNEMKELAAGASLICCYVSMKDEADTRAFLNWCFENNRPVAVPKTGSRTLTFHRIHSPADLKPGVFGVLEPAGDETVDPSFIDLMFVPLSAFDRQGHRTGYGKGYYDSVLTQTMQKVGIAYPEQEVDRIEPDPWDVTLDAVICPK